MLGVEEQHKKKNSIRNVKIEEKVLIRNNKEKKVFKMKND